jgi:uncharacterized membrane protein YfcA
MLFLVVLAAAAVLAGGLAAVTGFGIGSLLTPVLAARVGIDVAVGAVAIPHFIGTTQRFWLLRHHVHREVLLGFGLASAVGGLAGALAHTRIASRSLALLFGLVLILAGVSELTGWIERARPGRRAAWVAGLLSGALGGLVGNQGGLRSAAMLGFDVPKESYIATATAVGLIVDLARLPVYLATRWGPITELWPLLLLATAGVSAGTVLGTRVLARLPRRAFRRVVACMLLLLGTYMLVAGRG